MVGVAEIRKVWGDKVNDLFLPVDPVAVDQIVEHHDQIATVFGPEQWNPLGVPSGSGRAAADYVEYCLWAESLVLPAPRAFVEILTGPVAVVERLRDRDEAIAEAVGYRFSMGPRPQPWTRLSPADVCTIRLIASETQHKQAVDELLGELRDKPGTVHQWSLPFIKLGEEHWLLNAVPYLLPGRIGAELVTSDPPDPALIERIRLPYPHVLVFFDQLTIDTIASPEFDPDLVLTHPENSVDPSGRGIIGVVLAGDDNGRLLPWVQWLVAEHVVDIGWSVHPVVGLWPRCQLAGAVANLAAICTWGDWRQPPPTPPQVTGEERSRTWRRSLQKSGARKAIKHGALTNVRVLNIDPVTVNTDIDTDSPATGTATGRRVRTHWRAGHWVRFRLATRDADGRIIGSTRGEPGVDWMYVARWIRPVLVNPDLSADPGLTVYVVQRRTGDDETDNPSTGTVNESRSG